jgi:hypothetical protein
MCIMRDRALSTKGATRPLIVDDTQAEREVAEFASSPVKESLKSCDELF